MNEIDIYIQNFPEDVQEMLSAIRNIVQELAPQATERICMRMPTFDLDGRWLVHYAAYAKHIGFYPQPDGIAAFEDKLKMYKTSKGAVQFPLDAPLPLELIREIVAYKIEHHYKKEVTDMDKSEKSKEIIVPAELSSVLENDAEASAFFDSLTDGYKRGYCDWVGGAKQEATRHTRAGKALIMLQNKQKTLRT